MPPAPADTDAPWFEARLAHAEPGRRVVEASAWCNGRCLGRCLGEAADAETAEDRALARLRLRLTDPTIEVPVAAAAPGRPATTASAARPTAAAPVRIRPGETLAVGGPTPAEQGVLQPAAAEHQAGQSASQAWPAEQPAGPEELARDPEDWSDELAELDVQLARLQWDRNQESIYLQRAFGHPSRSRITTYADLLAYVRALRGLAVTSTPESAPVPLRRRDLLSQSDQLLASLCWDAARGRGLLEEHFQLASRQQLSDEQLLQFNMLLEEQLIAAGSAPATAASPG